MKHTAALSLTLTLLAQTVLAEEVPKLHCIGTAPEWRLNLVDQADFTFAGTTTLDIPHIATAEGQEWPKALTLIGDRDSGILILHRRICGTAPYEAQMLTQRGQTPILLTGCCFLAP
jgi:hypothetical protein